MSAKTRVPTPKHLEPSPPTKDVAVRDLSTAPHVGWGRTRLARAIGGALRLSLVLENKGNVARDHLASERTYLTYVQTSLACASAGILLVQLFMLGATGERGQAETNRLGRLLGATIVFFGVAVLVFGLVRYFRTQAALLRGYFPVAHGSISAMAFVLVLWVGIVFGVIAAGDAALIG